MSNKTMNETLASNNNNFVTYDNLDNILEFLNNDRFDLFTMLWNQDRVIIYNVDDDWDEFGEYCITQIKQGGYPINPKHRKANFYHNGDSIMYIKWDALILVRTTSTIDTEKTVTAPDGKTDTYTVQEEDTEHYGYTLYVYKYNDDPSKAELEPVNCDDSMDAIYDFIDDNYSYPAYITDLTYYKYIFDYKVNDWRTAIQKAIDNDTFPPVLPTSSNYPEYNAVIYYKCRQYVDDSDRNTQIVYVRTFYRYSAKYTTFSMSPFVVFDTFADVGFTDSQMDAIQDIIEAPA